MEPEPTQAREDGIRVAVRVRPLNSREQARAVDSSLEWNIGKTEIAQILSGRPVPANTFAFDQVFDETANNEDVFENLARPVVQAALEGFNATIFAYGQTSSGKTHSMLGSESDPGVTRRSIQRVFHQMIEMQDRQFLLRASYIEIYQEIIRDLLEPSHDNLKIHEDLNRRVYCDAREEVVGSVDEVMDIISRGESVRAVGETNMNDRSSRSHTIFTLLIESRERRQVIEGGDVGDELNDGIAVRASTLSLVDLAGSERAALTGAEGVRLKEGSHINKSLLTLGNVINKLSSGEAAATAHVPYRDSKLTRILQPALGGNARTAILCAITPAVIHMEETLSTLKFASRAKKVKNRTMCNEYLDDRAKLRRCQRELQELKQLISSYQGENICVSDLQGVAIPGDMSRAINDGNISPEVAQAITQQRIEAFQKKFELLCDATSERQCQSAPSGLETASDPSESSTPSSAEADSRQRAKRCSSNGNSIKSKETRGKPSLSTAQEPATVSNANFCCVLPGDRKICLREALDLVRSRNDVNNGRTLQFVEESPHDGRYDTEIAQTRKKMFEVERLQKVMAAEMDYERKAMASEVESLAEAAEEANKMRAAAEEDCENAMTAMAQSHAYSLVHELINTAMVVSESRSELKYVRGRLGEVEGLEREKSSLSDKVSALDRELGDALKREKRGVGPVLKEVNTLKSKLSESENQLKSTRQTLNKIKNEKTTTEKEVLTRDKQISVLECELQRYRKHEQMSQSRAEKELEAEREKLQQYTVEATKQIDLLNESIVRKDEQIRKHEESLKSKDDSLSKLNAEASSAAAELRTEQEKNESLAGKCSALERSVEQLSEEKGRSEATLAHSKNEVDQLTVEMANVHLSLEEKQSELNQTVENLNRQTATVTQLTDQLAQVSSNLEFRKATAIAAEQALQTERAQKSKLLEELDASDRRVLKLQEREKHIMQERDDANAAIQRELLAVDEFKREKLDALRHAEEEVEVLRKEQAAVQRALAMSNQQVGKLNQDLIANDQKFEKQIEALKSNIVDFQQCADAERQRCREAKAELKTIQEKSMTENEHLEEECQRLRAQSETLRERISNYEEQIVKTREAPCDGCNELSEKVKVLRGMHDDVHHQLDRSNAEVNEVRSVLDKEKERLRSEIVKVRESLAKEARNTTALLTKVYDRDGRVAELEGKLAEYRRSGGAIFKLERKVERRDAALTAQQAVITEQAAQLANSGLGPSMSQLELGQRLSRMESEAESLRQQLATRDDIIHQLEQREAAGQLERRKLRGDIKARELARAAKRANALQAQCVFASSHPQKSPLGPHDTNAE